MDYRFTKAERLNSKLAIDKLFAGGNASTVAFPLRIVYMRLPLKNSPKETDIAEGGGQKKSALDVACLPPVSVLMSVPKKRFHHATDRNRMKRLMRESYRLNKHILWNVLKDKDYNLAVAFICITDNLPTFSSVNKSMVKALKQISDKLSK